jgi:hypothetical protein
MLTVPLRAPLALRDVPVPHPFAELMPTMSEGDLARLATDVAARGVLTPIVLYGGQLLDGRHRVDAARAAGLAHIPAVEVSGTRREALDFVLAHNIHRRHLSPSQRAMTAARMRHDYGVAAAGDNTNVLNPRPIGQEEVARLVGVTSRYVRDAERLLGTGRADLIDEVDADRMSLRDALLRAFPRPARAPRPVLVDPMPANEAITAIPALDPAQGNVITQAARAIVALGGDPTAWLHTLSAEDARALVPVFEAFARRAVDCAIEEGTLAPAIVPVPGEQTTRTRAPRRSRAEMAAARRIDEMLGPVPEQPMPF